MRSVWGLLSRLPWSAAASARDEALQAEIDEHIALQTADNLRAGLSPIEARRQAFLKFGGVVAVKEAYRDQRELPAWKALKGVWRDLAYAGRSLTKARAFTIVCIVSLGIGMAPVIAIPYASRIFWIMPPAVKTEGLIEVLTTRVGPRQATTEWSYPDYLDLRAADTGAALFGWTVVWNEIGVGNGTSSSTSTSTSTEHNKWKTLYVSPNYFRTLGVSMARGPGFDNAMDGALRAEPVVILGDRFWQDRLGSDPAVVGKTLTLDGVPHVIVGVAPEQFQGHLAMLEADLFVPLERHPLLIGAKSARSDRAKTWVSIHGRLADGVGVGQANAAVSAVTSQLSKNYPATNEFTAGIVAPYDPFGSLDRSQFTRLKVIGLTLTGMVLLVVSLNISGMMQVRSAMRERELSIRQAIGANRTQLMQLLLAEALLLASVGGTFASIVLFNMPSTLSWFVGKPIPPEFHDALRVDFSMIAICVGLCFATSLVFGFLPATRFSRPVIISALKDEAGAGGLRVGRIHRVTAALQVTIAVPLLVMSGISLDRVRSTATGALGFDAELLYAAPLKLDAVPGQNTAFQIRIVTDDLAKTSGVVSVTVADGLPLDFRSRDRRVALQVDANVAPRWIVAHVTRVGDGYLKTLGIPLLRGRGFTADDNAGAEMVTIISKTLADKLFPDAEAAEPIGKRLTLGVAGADEQAPQTLTIVGVTADFPTAQMSSERQQLLLPFAQHANELQDSVPIGSNGDTTPATRGLHLSVIARSAPGEQPVKLVSAVENVARELDPDFQRTSVVTGAWLRQNSVRDFLRGSMVAGIAGAVILLLSALGIYGVVGLMVATRTREIAVRVALGATRRQVLGMVLFDVVKVVTPGIGLGLLLTVALLRLNSENMGISLSEVENFAYVVGAAIAVLVSVLASLAPARRAASVPAMVAMRSL